jgi:hypothetical protein
MAIYKDEEQDGNIEMWNQQNEVKNCTKKVHFYNIDYDTDGESINSPTELTLEVDEDIDVSLEGADYISDETGFCVNSFSFEIL